MKNQTYESIYDTLSAYIIENLEVAIDQPQPHHRLQEDLGLESIGLLSLAVEIENHYQIYLDESAESPPETLDDIIKLILLRLDN